MAAVPGAVDPVPGVVLPVVLVRREVVDRTAAVGNLNKNKLLLTVKLNKIYRLIKCSVFIFLATIYSK